MKKVVLFIAASLLTGRVAAQMPAQEQGYVSQEQDYQPLEPTYLDNVYSGNVWDSNWFLSVKGGVSAFAGKPVGHGDLFDRTEPLLNASVGKWFTPHIGARLSFQGFKLIDSYMQSRNFQNVQVNFLYNVSSHFRKNYDELPRWDFIPFLGCGIIRNAYNFQKPFSLSYGLMGRYRLARHLHISAEIGGTTTFQNFDGNGPDKKFGDNLLQASIGLDITLGKVGWKKVIDPKPYIFQNDILMERLGKVQQENQQLNKKHQKDAMALKEMRKILEIEGLLEKYDLAMSDDEAVKARPRNSYSGLNSLRARLRNKGWNGDQDDYRPVLADSQEGEPSDSTEMTPEDYFRLMKDGKVFVGAPIYFFFKIGSDNLTERAQVININEVASCIKKYGLHARVVGAADSQTGTAYGNERLSAKRADYIARLLREQGVPQEKIETQYRGGISTYEPLTGNRNTCVMLYFK